MLSSLIFPAKNWKVNIFAVLTLVTSICCYGQKRDSYSEISSMNFGGIVINSMPVNSIDVHDKRLSFRGKEIDAFLRLTNAEICILSPKNFVDTLLKGTITNADGDITFIESSNGGQALKIKPNGLRITIGEITSNLHDFFGGSLDLSGHKLWITNNKEIYLSSKEQRGSFDFSVESLEIKNLKLKTSNNHLLTIGESFNSVTDVSFSYDFGIGTFFIRLTSDLIYFFNFLAYITSF